MFLKDLFPNDMIQVCSKALMALLNESEGVLLLHGGIIVVLDSIRFLPTVAISVTLGDNRIALPMS